MDAVYITAFRLVQDLIICIHYSNAITVASTSKPLNEYVSQVQSVYH